MAQEQKEYWNDFEQVYMKSVREIGLRYNINKNREKIVNGYRVR